MRWEVYSQCNDKGPAIVYNDFGWTLYACAWSSFDPVMACSGICPSRSVAFVCLFLLLSVVNSDKYLPFVKSRKGIFVGASG